MTRSMVALLLVVSLAAGGCGTAEVSAPPSASPSASAVTDWHDATLDARGPRRGPPRRDDGRREDRPDDPAREGLGRSERRHEPAPRLGAERRRRLAADRTTPTGWYAMVDAYQEAALATRLGIPILYGVDAVHGHNNVVGATIFPHNIGLGAAGDPELVERIGRATAVEMAATGIRWDFAPVVAVPAGRALGPHLRGLRRGPARWSAELGSAFIRGLQGADLTASDAVAATAKHFIGDGGTAWGSSTAQGYLARPGRDRTRRGDAARHPSAAIRGRHRSRRADRHGLLLEHRDGKVHGDHHLLTEVLKGELGFSGFVVSDWGGVDQVECATTPRRWRRPSTRASTWSWSRTTGRASRTAVRAGLARAPSTRRPRRRRRRAHPARQVRAGPVRDPMPPGGSAADRRVDRSTVELAREAVGRVDGAAQDHGRTCCRCRYRATRVAGGIWCRTTSGSNPAAGRSMAGCRGPDHARHDHRGRARRHGSAIA